MILSGCLDLEFMTFPKHSESDLWKSAGLCPLRLKILKACTWPWD